MTDCTLSPLDFQLSLWFIHYNARLNPALNTKGRFYCGPVYEHISIFITRHCIRPARDGLAHTSAVAASESKNPDLRSEDTKLWFEIPSVIVFLKDTKCSSIAFSQTLRDRGGKPSGLITTRNFLNIILGNDQVDTQLLYFTIRLL